MLGELAIRAIRLFIYILENDIKVIQNELLNMYKTPKI